MDILKDNWLLEVTLGERLPFYIAEYVWRYNNRSLSIDEQVERILNLVAEI